MNIVVFQENLLRQLSLASRFLPTKTTTIPGLNNVLVEATKETISITASNIETTITTQIQGKVEKEGTALLPAKTILSLLPSLAGEKISISLEKNRVNIQGEKTEVSLTTEDPKEFPSIKKGKVIKEATLEKATLLDIVDKVSFAASLDPTRVILTSILVGCEDGKLIAVATDGFRLARLEKTIGKKADFSKTPFPGKMFDLLGSILKETDDKEVPLSFFDGGNQVLFTLKTASLSTQTIAGSFPDYNRIIPSSWSTKITVSREEFLRGVKFASVLARESSNIVKLSINGNAAVITANAPQTGENKITVPVEKEGENVETAFNYRFVLDFLNASGEKDVIFETGGPLSPGVFRFVKSPEYLYIVMPVRLQDSQ